VGELKKKVSTSEFYYQGHYLTYDALSSKAFSKELRVNPRQIIF
jgi:hypothetical protein